MGCSSSTSVSKVGVKHGKRAKVPNASFLTGFFDHYKLDAKLSQGSYAEVWLITGKADSNRKCVKLLDLRDAVGEELPALVERAAMEVRIAQKVGCHPNVVKVYGAYKHPDMVFLVMEKCDCSLEKYRRSSSHINEKLLAILVFQMLSSLHHLHSLRVVHRDVKPDNFLLGGPSGRRVKLCDFGLAAVLPAHGMLRDRVGTPSFMCPEMCSCELPGSLFHRLVYGGSWYNESADIWSLAVTLYVMVFATFPYVSKNGTPEGTMRAIAAGVAPTFKPTNKARVQPSPNVCNFVHALLQRSPDLRPSAEKALTFPYMAMIGPQDPDVSTPCLSFETNLAHKVGHFSSERLSENTDQDDLLSIVQYKNLCVRMPQARESEDLDEKRPNEFIIDIDEPTLSEGSTAISTTCELPPSIMHPKNSHMSATTSCSLGPSEFALTIPL